MHIFDSYDDTILTDLVFDSNLSAREMAIELGASEIEVTKRIRELGLSWVRRRDGHMSRGQAALTQAMRKLLPGEKIVTEEPIGYRLRLDVYCPSYKLAAEYHGRQHFMYVEHFHGNKEGYYDSQRRDAHKLEICGDLGIALVAFRYCDTLDEDTVFGRLLEAIQNAPRVEKPERKTIKGEPHYEAWLQRQREYRQQSYRKMRRTRS